MKFISLNEYLCANNLWTERLLSNAQIYQKERTIEQIENEYNIEIYGRILEEAQKDLNEYRRSLLYGFYNQKIYVSIEDDIYLMPASMYTAMKRNKIMEIINKYFENDPICELGAGYGQNLIWLKEYQSREVYGGEYSNNAILLAKMLGLEVYKFNFYNEKDYSLITRNSNILTVHSVEQVKDATIIIECLRNIKDKVKYIMHCEPIYNDNRKNLIGLLRNKYAKINDYNTNLLSTLKENSDIEIVHAEFDVWGNNPLNPSSIIVWRFK